MIIFHKHFIDILLSKIHTLSFFFLFPCHKNKMFLQIRYAVVLVGDTGVGKTNLLAR